MGANGTTGDLANEVSILVIGATGNVGGAVVDHLVAAQSAGAKLKVRAMVRNPATSNLPIAVETVAGDLTDVASVRGALDGMQRVFLVWPFGSAQLALPVIAEIAARADRVVYLSAIGVRDDGGDAGDPIGQFHTDIESSVRATDLEWTFVRSGGMASNTLGWADEIRAGSVVRWPYGHGARALVHEADLAEIAVLALTGDDLVGLAPEISGPASLSQIDQMRDIGSALGRELRWEELPRAEALTTLLSFGWTEAMAEGALDGWAALVEAPQEPTGGFERITGRAGRSFAQWATDHVQDFS